MAGKTLLKKLVIAIVSLLAAQTILLNPAPGNSAVNKNDAVNALPDGQVLVWVSFSPDADLYCLKTDIESQAGEIFSLAPEGKLLVGISPEKLETLTMAEHIRSVEPASLLEDSGVEELTCKEPGMGDRPPTARERRYIEDVYTGMVGIEPNLLSRQRARLQGVEQRPASVDNTLSQYFPPIRSQGQQNSCTCWAACYYYNTYTQARDENLDVSGGDNDHINSPAFMYPLVNAGVNGGASTQYVVARLNDVGCCSWTLKPYEWWDWTSWPTEEAWVEALRRRTANAHMIGSYSGAGDAQLNAIKQHLANGHIAATRTDVYSNWHPTFLDNQGRGIQNGVLFSHAGESYKGGHAMTIVGYDDNRSYYDGSTTRYGAFLIANSWGTGWGTYNSTGSGSRGFMWVAYDYFKANNSCFGMAFYNDDRDDYRPQLYAAGGLNHDQRGRLTYSGGVGSTGSPDWVSYEPIDRDGGNSISINDTRRVAVDLTGGIPFISDYDNIELLVKLSVSSSAGTDGTITSADFFYDFDGNENFQMVSSTDPAVTVMPGQTGYAAVNFSPEPEPLNLSGTVTFEYPGWVQDTALVMYQVREPGLPPTEPINEDTTTVSMTTGYPAFGSFTINGVPDGTYDVALKHCNHIADMAPAVVVAGADVTGLEFTLWAGDADGDDNAATAEATVPADSEGDNDVDLTDYYTLYYQYIGSLPVTTGYNADFDGDGDIDLNDYFGLYYGYQNAKNPGNWYFE